MGASPPAEQPAEATMSSSSSSSSASSSSVRAQSAPAPTVRPSDGFRSPGAPRVRIPAKTS